MAEFIPPLSTCLSRMTSGEKRFARRCEALLEDDYLVFYDIPVGNKRRYPDFIILHARRGLLFLEVKDWKEENIKNITKKDVELFTSSGLKTISNPVEQVRQCAYQGLVPLERDSHLQHSKGKHKGRLCFPYGYGVVLSNITRNRLHQGIPSEQRDSVLPDSLLICKDEMTESVDALEFQEHLWNMFQYRFGEPLTLPQIDRIRGHLYPEIRVDFYQSRLFDQNEDKTEKSLEEAIPEVIKVMDIKQEKLARSLGEGHRIIHGVAGAGKTLILGFRCLYLAEMASKPILVLCYNITLAVKLKAFIENHALDNKVHVYHFHDWCGEQLRRYHVNVIDSEKPYWERQVESVIDGVEKGHIPRAQYGALLIDEGHDFEPDWLKLVVQMVDPKTDSLLLLYDDAQSIYAKKSRLNFTLKSVGINAVGRSTVLKLNYRNTREILDFAYQFVKDYLEQRGSEDIPIVEPEAAGVNGTQPVLKKFTSISGEIDYTLRCIQQRHKKGQSWRDIVVLYPVKWVGRKLSEKLKANNIPHDLISSSQSKKNYRPDSDHVTLMPIPSSKGLEFDTVVIIHSSFSHVLNKNMNDPSEEERNSEIADDFRRLYVGMTRAKKNLLVTYSKENLISQALENIQL